MKRHGWKHLQTKQKIKKEDKKVQFNEGRTVLRPAVPFIDETWDLIFHQKNQGIHKNLERKISKRDKKERKKKERYTIKMLMKFMKPNGKNGFD